MGRGRMSKAQIKKGKISYISCPCGWERSFKFNDERLCDRMCNSAKKNHKKKCDQLGDFKMTDDGEFIETKEEGFSSMINESFRRNEEDIKSEKWQAEAAAK